VNFWLNVVLTLKQDRVCVLGTSTLNQGFKINMSKKVKILPIEYPIILKSVYFTNEKKCLEKELDNLIKLQEKVKVKPIYSRKGICANYKAFTGEYLNCSYWYSRYWPKFSGHPSYPIKCAGRNPEDIYWSHNDKWTLKTQYGRDRHEYLQFLIDIIKGELEYAKEHNL
jgi:hypothetical protein